MANGNIVTFGSYYVNDVKRKIPKNPVQGGDVILEYGVDSIRFGDTGTDPEYQLQWVEYTVGKKRLLFCDRVLQVFLSWDQLNSMGFVSGLPVTIDGQDCIARLPTGGLTAAAADNEWDSLVCSEVPGPLDEIWHWSTLYSWCGDTPAGSSPQRTSRGGTEAARFRQYYSDETLAILGFRPVLEISAGAPVLSGEAGEKGKLASPLRQEYSVALPSGGSFTVTETVGELLLRRLENQLPGSFCLDLSSVWVKLANHTAYTATVTVTTEEGGSASLQWHFTKENLPPAPPVPLFPLKGARIDPEGYAAFLAAADPEGNNQSFSLAVSASSSFTEGETLLFTEGLERLSAAGEWLPAGDQPILAGDKLRLPYSIAGADGSYYFCVTAADPDGSGEAASSEAISVSVGSSLIFQTKPLVMDRQPLAVTLAIDRTVDEAASLQIWVANNALDDTPAWEDMTSAFAAGQAYSFVNPAKSAGEWAVSIRAELSAGNATGPIRLRRLGLGII